MITSRLVQNTIHYISGGAMMRTRILGMLTFVCVASTPVLAQETVGDLAKKGAEKLTKPQTTALLTGATISGPTRAGGTVTLS
jgi:hypothetical protein